MTAETRRARGADAVLALLLGLAVAAVYRLTLQERLLGDGAGLVAQLARGVDFNHHLLYLPAARLVRALVPGEDPLFAPLLLSAVAGGLGCGASWLLVRRLGASRFGATAGALLLAASPAAWFFATTVEVHSLHLLAAAIAALVVLALPWERAPLAAPAAALALGASVLVHQTAVLLLPGLALLAEAARARRAEPFSRAGLLGVAGALAAGAGAAVVLSALVRHGTPFPRDEAEILRFFTSPARALDFLREGWAEPLLLLLPVAAVGIARGQLSLRARRALVAAVLVPLAALAAFGVPERGGYALGHAPFLAALAALALPRATTAATLAAVLLVGAQGAAARAWIGAWDRGFAVEARVERVRALTGGEGLFLSTIDGAPPVDLWLPGVKEESLWVAAGHSFAHGVPPEDFAAALLVHAEEAARAEGRFVLDLSFRRQAERDVVAARAPYLDAFTREVERRFPTSLVDDPSWPMLVVVGETERD